MNTFLTFLPIIIVGILIIFGAILIEHDERSRQKERERRKKGAHKKSYYRKTKSHYLK